MNLYFAPLEGITKYVYRKLHAEMFGGCDAYFAPFINPSENEKISRKNLVDILPENNQVINLKVQALTNRADSLAKFADEIKLLGYDEVNLNFGCPSATVVNKRRGAGILRDTDDLDRFLYDIFEFNSDIKISVKTRTGYLHGDEMEELIQIYNKYPLSCLIIHPRVRADFYNGEPDMDVFEAAYVASVNKVCYNGDICSVEDYKRITEKFPELDGIMIGRGAIANPAIFREINGGGRLTTQELIIFSEKLIKCYSEILRSDVFTLQKLKEVWIYIMNNYPEESRILKAIKKANKLPEFMNAIACLPELD